jgi:agmatinase
MTEQSFEPPPSLRAQTDGAAFLGPTTFAKVRGISEPEELDAMRPAVAVVGAPWDDSVTYRPGARFGPRAVRTANYLSPMWHLELEVAPFDELRVVDYGDAVCPPGMVEESHAAIEQRVGEVVDRGIVPLVIGGDHSITLPSASAVARAISPRRLGVLHFDAHADTADESWGNLRSHGTPMRRLIESGAVRGTDFVQVGLRGYWPPPEVIEWMREQGMRWHLMGEVVEAGADAVVERAIEQVLQTADAIYLSVDIDVLDPGFAPGTGTPEPGGMNPADLLRAIRRIALSTEIVGVDVVEVSPPYDHAEVTAQNANRCLMELVSALAVKRRGGGGDRKAT